MTPCAVSVFSLPSREAAYPMTQSQYLALSKEGIKICHFLASKKIVFIMLELK